VILPLEPDVPLSPVEAHGRAVLLDQARLLVLEAGQAGAVRLAVSEGSPGGTDPAIIRELEPVITDGLVTLPRGALRAVGRLAAAVEEQESAAADRHGRVPSEVNPSVRDRVWREPGVSGLARRLRRAVIAAAGERPVRLLAPWPQGRRWAACLTSDLDLVTGWPAAVGLRVVELLRRGEGATALRALGSSTAALGRDPVTAAAVQLLAALAARGFRGTWFIISGTPTPATWLKGDITYRPEHPRARRVIENALADGHEAGLHGSFATMLDAARLTEERVRLERVTRRPVRGGRQHFLRMRPGATQRAQRAAGLTYDATFGFPDRNGFRLASADIVPGWDAEAQAASGLDLVPLIWMDRAQSKYAGIEDPEAWVRDALELAAVCREHEGLWVGLWHPNLAPSLGFPGADRALDTLLDGLAAGEPFRAPLGELVAWRARRRAARGVALDADGTPTVRGGEGLALETPAGTPAPFRIAPGGTS